MSYKNFPMVPRVIFGRGSFNQLDEIISPKRLSVNAPFIFLVDDVFKGKSWLTSRIPLSYQDSIIYISADEEPKTSQVDELTEQIRPARYYSSCHFVFLFWLLPGPILPAPGKCWKPHGRPADYQWFFCLNHWLWFCLHCCLARPSSMWQMHGTHCEMNITGNNDAWTLCPAGRGTGHAPARPDRICRKPSQTKKFFRHGA